MNSRKPKGKTPTLLSGSSGKPKLARVGAKSKCYRCSAEMKKGDIRVEVPKLGTSFLSTKKYCSGCFLKILARTHQDLAEFEEEFKEAREEMGSA